MDLEQHNHEQIEALNQRGGRTLSIVDLIRSGTLSVEMAACAVRAMAEGASLLTGARPGGAGKTTLMAALLHLLSPGTRIVTVDRPGAIAEALARPAEPACYLAHEIGAGHWFGYIWGRSVADYLSLIEGPRRVASCLHADTLEELTGILCSPPLGASREALGRVGLVLFMHVRPGPRGLRHRVAAFHEADGRGGHRLAFQWNERSDTFERVGGLRDPAGLTPYTSLIQRLVDTGVAESVAVRREVLTFHTGVAPS
ncbi:MAG TPA: hypothetical protein VNE39_27965 [Planctomycetota bacterium]|nr:hypothetical protein [Planctomycetota bacterium]